MLLMITVRHLNGDEWEVTVNAGVTSTHRVRVTKADRGRFAGSGSTEDLLQESFRFLLERESNTSIMRSFDLPVIGSYFPEYETQIRQRLGAG